MADIVTPEVRSRMMRGIKGKNTKPEIQLRKQLFKAEFRYRLHRRDLPRRPDIVLPKWKTVIFVHGFFWHRHSGCSLAATPKTRAEFWQQKFDGNVGRDARNCDELLAGGWRVMIVWECMPREQPDQVISEISDWLKNSNARFVEFPVLEHSSE